MPLSRCRRQALRKMREPWLPRFRLGRGSAAAPDQRRVASVRRPGRAELLWVVQMGPAVVESAARTASGVGSLAVEAVALRQLGRVRKAQLEPALLQSPVAAGMRRWQD